MYLHNSDNEICFNPISWGQYAANGDVLKHAYIPLVHKLLQLQKPIKISTEVPRSIWKRAIENKFYSSAIACYTKSNELLNIIMNVGAWYIISVGWDPWSSG